MDGRSGGARAPVRRPSDAAEKDVCVSQDEPQPERPDEEQDVSTPETSQDELNRTSRATGGDAPAAGSIEEREGVARDDSELFEDDEQGTDG